MLKATVLVATTHRCYPTVRLALALAKAGCQVEALCPSNHPLAMTRAARRLHSYYGLAPLRSLRHAISTSQPEFIVPCDDLSTQHLYRLHERERQAGEKGRPLCALIERSLGAPESYPLVSARAAFMELARKEGVRVPATLVIETADDLKRWASQFGFPTVLKANGSSGGDGTRVVHTLEEADRAFRRLQAPPLLARAAKRALIDGDNTLVWPSLLRRRSVVNAQAFVVGHEATSSTLCWRGVVLARLHFEVLKKVKPTGHATVLRRIEHPEMSDAVEKVARRLNLSGWHGFDFMLEAHTGNAYLIEINPRITQVGHLALGPGHDLPAAFYAALSGNPIREAPKVTEKDTVALFPQEWIRDPASEFLRSAYHDVPWEEPALVSDSIRQSRTQRGWYTKENSAVCSPSVPLGARAKSRTVELDCEAK
ncbi:MAG TPA: ATP-grasp domain-containing protein [Terriglobales bacterium]|nr:ATP-grasp domain-containing protein [Terriglobales bacterium]